MLTVPSHLAQIFRQEIGASKYLSLDGLANMAYIESRFNQNAKSPTGATGLFQFTRGTWQDIMGKESASNSRLNPTLNTRAAIKLANRNGQHLESRIDKKIDDVIIYIAHNIGAGGAVRLLSCNKDLTVSAALLGSNPYHNPKFFISNGRPVKVSVAIERYYSEFY